MLTINENAAVNSTVIVRVTHAASGQFAEATVTVSERTHEVFNMAPGGTFTDNAGVVWRVLRNDSHGTLIIFDQPTTTTYRWNDTGSTFGSATHNGAANRRLNTLFSEIGTDVQAMARGVNLGTDFRTATGAISEAENNPPAGQIPGVSLGMSGPTLAQGTANNALFHLSRAESGYYFANDAARSSARAWWLRSPGTNALTSVSFVGLNGNRNNTDAAIRRAVRPALWIAPPTP